MRDHMEAVAAWDAFDAMVPGWEQRLKENDMATGYDVNDELKGLGLL